MPQQDRYHETVLRCLEKDGWTILREQEYISIGSGDNTNRRLYIDIKARRGDDQLALIEVKGLERSPMHEMMEMVGQYLIYRMALDYLSIEIPLYVAIPEAAYQNAIMHTVGQQMMARYNIPLIIFDPVREEIIKWMPQL